MYKLETNDNSAREIEKLPNVMENQVPIMTWPPVVRMGPHSGKPFLQIYMCLLLYVFTWEKSAYMTQMNEDVKNNFENDLCHSSTSIKQLSPSEINV